MAEAENNSSGNTSPKRHEQVINVVQPRYTSLWAQISRMGKPRLLAQTGGVVRATVARVGAVVADAVARLPRGRRPYPQSYINYIIAVAEELKPDPSRETQRHFIDSVSVTLTELADPSRHRDFHR